MLATQKADKTKFQELLQLLQGEVYLLLCKILLQIA